MKEHPRTDAQRLGDMRNAIQRISALTGGLHQTGFLTDRTVQEAVAFNIMALGEAAGGISKRTQHAHPVFDWRRLGALRQSPAHEYCDLKPEYLWDFVRDVLPTLETRLRKVRPATRKD